MQNRERIRIRTLILCALFAALSAAGAFIKIPFFPLPLTLQFFFTTMAGLILGAKYGAASVGVYVALGLLGLPVFTQGGGLSYVLMPTFGYLPGFVAAAFVTGLIAKRKSAPSFIRFFAAGLAGLGVLYLFGISYYFLINRLYFAVEIGADVLFWNFFLLPLPGDIVKCLAAAAVANRLRGRLL